MYLVYKISCRKSRQTNTIKVLLELSLGNHNLELFKRLYLGEIIQILSSNSKLLRRPLPLLVTIIVDRILVFEGLKSKKNYSGNLVNN